MANYVQDSQTHRVGTSLTDVLTGETVKIVGLISADPAVYKVQGKGMAYRATHGTLGHVEVKKPRYYRERDDDDSDRDFGY
jgi:hypothetical protein